MRSGRDRTSEERDESHEIYKSPRRRVNCKRSLQRRFGSLQWIGDLCDLQRNSVACRPAVQLIRRSFSPRSSISSLSRCSLGGSSSATRHATPWSPAISHALSFLKPSSRSTQNSVRDNISRTSHRVLESRILFVQYGCESFAVAH